MNYWGEGNHQQPGASQDPGNGSWRHDPARKGLGRGKRQMVLIPLAYMALFGAILLLAWLFV